MLVASHLYLPRVFFLTCLKTSFSSVWLNDVFSSLTILYQLIVGKGSPDTLHVTDVDCPICKCLELLDNIIIGWTTSRKGILIYCNVYFRQWWEITLVAHLPAIYLISINFQCTKFYLWDKNTVIHIQRFGWQTMSPLMGITMCIAPTPWW